MELVGLDVPSRLLVATSGWPRIEVSRRRGSVPYAPALVGTSRSEFPLVGNGRLVVEGAQRQVVFTTPDVISDSELIHPYFAPAAASFALWEGREAFHGGAFVHEGRAWALLGGRGSGKSSMLAWMARRGYEVICDDLLIVEEGRVLAGPRCIDLRPSAARRLGARDLLERERRRRWRLALPPLVPEIPLGGWVFLAWGSELSAVRLPPVERLPRLAAHRSLLVEPMDAAGLLQLAALPAWQLTRPKEWDTLDRAISRLLTAARTNHLAGGS